MTAQEAKQIIGEAFVTDQHIQALYGVDANRSFDEQFSPASLESILIDNVAIAVSVCGQLLRQHKRDVEAMLAEQSIGSVTWYAWKARQFQFGQPLVPDTDRYDNSNLSPDEVEACRVIAHSACVEARDRSLLYLKVARSDKGSRLPLTAEQLRAFSGYLDAYRYAGTRIQVINAPADEMKLAIDVYYNPLVLNASGKRLDGTADTPVQDAIRIHLQNTPFNGVFTNQSLVDALQRVEGVVVAELKASASRRQGDLEFTPIDARCIPYAGYFAINDEHLTINFIPNEELL